MSAQRKYDVPVTRSQSAFTVIDGGLPDVPEVESKGSTVGKRIVQGAVAVGTAVAVGVANAAVDVTAATTAITTDGTAAISAVGGALIGLAATAVVFKWVKGSIFS